MKARVKATGEIVNVTHIGTKYYLYDLNNVEIIDEPDYWDKLHHQAAISAMSAFVIRGCKPEDVAQLSWELAGVMIDKLKNEK